ncbi:MAG: HAD family phosphatase, partial [Clostridiales bacterium]|nr:HAD family phosphatase [Clostridiales bacterium]
MREDLSIRLIATDVDGTMLDSRGMMTDENLRAIQNAQEKGITVAIASGRFAENVYVLLQKYGLSCPIIAMNGGKITDEKLQTHTVHFMDPEAVNAVYDTLARA